MLMQTRERCDERMEFRFQPSLRRALADGAAKELVPASALVREAVIEKLRAIGIEPQKYKSEAA